VECKLVVLVYVVVYAQHDKSRLVWDQYSPCFLTRQDFSVGAVHPAAGRSNAQACARAKVLMI
jgi:hypothetical protein